MKYQCRCVRGVTHLVTLIDDKHAHVGNEVDAPHPLLVIDPATQNWRVEIVTTKMTVYAAYRNSPFD
jgi:hypothetical protein